MHEPNWLMALGLVGIAALWLFCYQFILFECACIQVAIYHARTRKA